MMRTTVDARDVACAIGLSLLTILSRLPYRMGMLYNWDAVQFALALRDYDIEKHQPHPPGYILYVVMGRLLYAWLPDANAAYVTLAVAFSGLTTFVVYLLARRMFDRPTAIGAAALLAVSPLFWFYGSVGLTYAGEALAASTVAYLTFRFLQGSGRGASVPAVALGLAGGIRQSILIVLFPLWLGATIWKSRRAGAIVGSCCLLMLAGLVWFVPMVWLTGGLHRYVAASMHLAQHAVLPTTVGRAPIDGTLAQARHVLESVVVGLGPLALAAVALPAYVRRRGFGREEWFLVGWTVPPVLVYVFVHFGQAGYVLTFLPALVILLTRVLLVTVRGEWLAGRVRVAGPALAVLLIVLINGSFFVNAKPLPQDGASGWQRRFTEEVNRWIWSRTAAALQEHEMTVRTFVDAIRGLYPSDETAIITEIGNPRSYTWLRHAMFYLPEYPIYQLRVGEDPPLVYAPRLATSILASPGSRIPVPAGVRRLVWFVDRWSGVTRPPGLVEIELSYGRYLYALRLGRRPVHYAGYTFVPERRARAVRHPG
jgi:hypothetical protein